MSIDQNNKKSISRNKRKELLGYINSPETRVKMSLARKGKKLSEDHKRKISLSTKGLKKPPITEETRKKMSVSQIGRKLSNETKEKIRQKMLGKKYSLGRVNSKETRLKMSMSHRGEKNPRWQGGLSYQPYPADWTEVLRDSIRERDNFMCQECGVHQDELSGRFMKLMVHHIDYNKENLEPKNLISLCHICHIKTNHNRAYWLEKFSLWQQ